MFCIFQSLLFFIRTCENSQMTLKVLNGGCNLARLRVNAFFCPVNQTGHNYPSDCISKGMRRGYSGQNVGQTHKSIQLIKHIDGVDSSPAVCSFSHLSTSLFSTSVHLHAIIYSLICIWSPFLTSDIFQKSNFPFHFALHLSAFPP